VVQWCSCFDRHRPKTKRHSNVERPKTTVEGGKTMPDGCSDGLGTDPIGEVEAEAHAHGICFKNGPPSRVGVELEWLVHDALDPLRPVDPARLAAAFADLQRLTLDSALTQEPGGQLELSSAPATSLTACVESMAADLAAVRGRLRDHGLTLAGYGHDPWHEPSRVLRLPRYTAMESYFDRSWPLGRSMMCSTASVQICVDAGHDGPGPHGYLDRWRLAHLLGPVLIAAFANSPLSRGRPTGIRSTRQAVWTAIDPARTSAPGEAADPRAAWARYALDAPVLCVRQESGAWSVPDGGMTFREWARAGARGEGAPRPPTADDLAYHLTTLFPPVRPHGHLELRMIDAQPGDDGWIVPLAVTVALLDDPEAAVAAQRTLEPLAAQPYAGAPGNALWRRAARHGLTDPALRHAALVCFAAAGRALPGLGASAAVCSAVAEFTERHVARGRCPADDLLDGFLAERRDPVTRMAPLVGKDGRS
jgi:glutamate--cysteine ligase